MIFAVFCMIVAAAAYLVVPWLIKNVVDQVLDEKNMFIEEETEVENLIETITAIRNKRSEKNIPPSKKSDLYFISSNEVTKKYTCSLEHLYRFLASCSKVLVMDKDEEIANSMVVICNNQKIYIPLDGLVDYEKELEKLDSQFIIVTHSPILLGMPDAEIFTFDKGMISLCNYEETDSYQVTKLFINNRKQMLHQLFCEEE